MTVKTRYEPGTPCWIDLGTPDQDAAGEFYGRLFGWELQEDSNAEQTGGYRTAQLEGQNVGGVMKLMQEGQPPAWLTYICVEDAEATADKVREAGGAVHVEPMTVLDYGTMAVLADPAGAAFGIWQPGRNIGADVMREPGSVAWNELNTRDAQAARDFYGAVFGWNFEDQEFGDSGTYTILSLGEESFGGLFDISGRLPDEVPSHWLVYFGVEDCEKTVATAKEAGGEIRFGPETMSEVGTIAVIKDPFGAVFAVIEPDPTMGGGE